MSELDVALLARHVRLLLRCYPKAYRAHRGEEILDTLLETTRPGRGWPPPREVASVIGGGLRARRAANLNQGLRASLRHVGILAAAMLMELSLTAALFPGLAGNRRMYVLSHRGYPPGVILANVLVLLALAAAWSGRRRLLAAVVGVGAAAAASSFLGAYPVAGAGVAAGDGVAAGLVWVVLAVPTVLALVFLLPLTNRAQRPPTSLLWLPCLALALDFVTGLTAGSGLSTDDLLPVPAFHAQILLYPYASYLSLVPVLVAVCWLVTDVRPLAAVTLQFLLMRVIAAVSSAYIAQEIWPQVAIAVGLPLALTGALIWLLRRRARTAPPTIG